MTTSYNISKSQKWWDTRKHSLSNVLSLDNTGNLPWNTLDPHKCWVQPQNYVVYIHMKGPFCILPADLKYKVMLIQLPKETPWTIACDYHLYYVYVSNSPTLTAVRYGRESSWMLSYSLIISWAAQYFIWDEMISLLLCFLQTYNNNLLLTRSITKPKMTV